ncbi:hypothetical protein Tco_1364794 [Tanacetum coccineum]
MYRNSPVRNPRAKGIKVKNVLQVCLLVAVCFWLIFQVKRSHDKRKEFDASDNKVSLSSLTRSGDEIAKLGRKDLQPKLEKTGDEEQDEDKIEEEKDDGRDDEIDENEQEKPDVEIDREEVDVVGEEKETEESDEKENENENVSEEKDVQSQTENEVSSEEHTHEAREENYKADDASSAVTHTGRTLGTENEIKNGTIVALSENVGQTAENGTSTSPNTTVMQENDPEPLVSDVSPASSFDSSENGPPSDTTLITSQSTETQNITAVTEESSNPTNISNSEVTESNESSSDPSKTELETETNNVTEGTEETMDPDEVQHDTIDSTDLPHLEEKDVRTDLDTLPDIETEGGNNEDTAAE